MGLRNGRVVLPSGSHLKRRGGKERPKRQGGASKAEVEISIRQAASLSLSREGAIKMEPDKRLDRTTDRLTPALFLRNYSISGIVAPWSSQGGLTAYLGEESNAQREKECVAMAQGGQGEPGWKNGPSWRGHFSSPAGLRPCLPLADSFFPPLKTGLHAHLVPISLFHLLQLSPLTRFVRHMIAGWIRRPAPACLRQQRLEPRWAVRRYTHRAVRALVASWVGLDCVADETGQHGGRTGAVSKLRAKKRECTTRQRVLQRSKLWLPRVRFQGARDQKGGSLLGLTAAISTVEPKKKGTGGAWLSLCHADALAGMDELHCNVQHAWAGQCCDKEGDGYRGEPAWPRDDSSSGKCMRQAANSMHLTERLLFRPSHGVIPFASPPF